MGCDIHAYKEKLINGKWVTADAWEAFDYGDDPGDKGVEVLWKNRFTDRNYELFDMLSKGVRCDHDFSFEPRGVPFNSCDEYKNEVQRWGIDGHSHSYLYLHELKEFADFLKSKSIVIEGMMQENQLAKLRESIALGSPDWNLIFPYCGNTNAKDHIDFVQEVPADFYVGDSLRKLISQFDGIDGDNQRIVFFFDN